MFFRTLKLFILMAFVLPATLQAMEDEDLIIAYHIPHQKKQELFNRVVRNVIIGEVGPRDYHVTLGIVKNVRPADYRALRKKLNKIASAHIENDTFTATLAKKYLVNRNADQSPIVLTPKPEEVVKLKNRNRALFNKLEKYNRKTGNHYVFHDDVKPPVFDPHITLINSLDIHNRALDRNLIIDRLNAQINGSNLELLHGTPVPVVRHRPQGRRHCPHGRRCAPHFVRPVPHFVRPVPHFVRPVPHFVRPVPHFVRPVPHFVRPVPHYRGRAPHFVRPIPHYRGPAPHFRRPAPHYRGSAPYFRGPRHNGHYFNHPRYR